MRAEIDAAAAIAAERRRQAAATLKRKSEFHGKWVAVTPRWPSKRACECV
jgi:hypothetical protein